MEAVVEVPFAPSGLANGGMFRIVPPGFCGFVGFPVANRNSEPVSFSRMIDPAISGLPGGQLFHPRCCDSIACIILFRTPRAENNGNGSFGKNGHGAE